MNKERGKLQFTSENIPEWVGQKNMTKATGQPSGLRLFKAIVTLILGSYSYCRCQKRILYQAYEVWPIDEVNFVAAFKEFEP